MFRNLIAAIVLTLPLLDAQSVTGTIGGKVFDASKKPITAASVALTREETNTHRDAKTNSDGAFQIPLLAPGTYRLEVERDGFRKYAQTIALELNQQVSFDITLAAGNVRDTVIVIESLPVLRAESATLSTVFENRSVTNLPLDGRNFYELSLLVPGASPAAPGSVGSGRGDLTFNINGARDDSNYYLLDGIYNVDPKLNGFGVTPPVDGVREYEVLTNSYDASFGRNAGGQINVILKSGTNALHSTAYEFLRNAVLDSTNYFASADQSKPKNIRNQFGFSLGGPIGKDKTFFFVDYQGTRVREGITRVSNVPTAQERTGDFSRSVLIPIDIFTFRPFPNFVIPRNRISPTALAIAALYPLPNRTAPGQNYVASPTQTDRDDHFDIRLDHRLSAASQLGFHYSFGDRDLFEPYGTPGSSSTIPGYGNRIPRRGQNVLLSETHTFTPSLLNELRLGFNRVSLAVNQQNQDNNINKAVGLPTISRNPRDNGLTQITINGFAQLGDELNNPQRQASTVYQINDTASWARGAHAFRFGFDFRKTQQNAFADVLSRGIIGFTGFSGNAMAEMLQNVVSYSTVARLDNPAHLRTESYNFFAQDSWRVRPNLTLTLGLRYEFNKAPVDADDRASIYDRATGSIQPVGKNGIPRAGYESDRNNFAPRIGLAWTPTAERNLVVRAGYGIFYDQSALAPSQGLYFSPPYYRSQLFIPSAQLPPVILEDPFPAAYPNFIPSAAFAFQRDLRTPYIQQWNLSVQRQLSAASAVEIGYVGTKGTKLIANRDSNQARPSTAQQNLRPNPRFQDIDTYESRANSNYHALQAKFTQRLSRGLTALASYTWAKSIDDASGFFSSTGDAAFPQDSNNARADRALSNFDVRHRATFSYTYDLPFRSKNVFLSGWQTAGVWSFQTGRPFTVALAPGTDNSNTGIPGIGFGVTNRPNLAGNPEALIKSPSNWFNTDAFRKSAFGTFGNAGRNIVEGPGFATVNVSVIKNTKLRESLTLQFRAEIFNLLDRANFDLPGNYLGLPNFGKISSAGDPRRVQFGAKFIF